MSAHGFFSLSPLLLLFLLLCNVVSYSEPTSTGTSTQERNMTTSEATMLMEPLKVVETKFMLFNDRRRRLNSFQICGLCTCCGGGGGKRLCLASPCCYAINCNIPNRPFGFCSFTPKSCNCFGC